MVTTGGGLPHLVDFLVVATPFLGFTGRYGQFLDLRFSFYDVSTSGGFRYHSERTIAQ